METATTKIPKHLLVRLSSSLEARAELERAMARRAAVVEVSDADVIESIDDVDADEWGITHTREAEDSYVALVRGTGGAAVARVVEDSWDYRVAA
jgi:hypothetical protein